MKILLTTDSLRSCRAAMNELGNADQREIGRWANNRVENSHQPFRRHEQAMLRFRRIGDLQQFVSVHANVHNLFKPERDLADRQTFKERRSLRKRSGGFSQAKALPFKPNLHRGESSSGQTDGTPSINERNLRQSLMT